MILHREDSDDARLSLRRGTQGHTTQTVEAERHGDHVRLSIRRMGGESVTVELDPVEVEALADWLTPVPHTEEES